MEAHVVAKTFSLVVFNSSFTEPYFMEMDKNVCASSLSFLTSIVVYFWFCCCPVALPNFITEDFEVSTLKFQ